MITPNRDDNRLPSLTGLRFVAAALVFLFHVGISGLLTPGREQHYFQRIFGAGEVGVSFFFILSGFVLTWSTRPRDTKPAFWRRRFVKIYPNHVVALAIALTGLALTARAGIGATITNLLLVHAWWPDPNLYFGANSVSWSLSCELFFYLLFPWLLGLLNRIRPARLWVAATTLTSAVLLVPLAISPLPADKHYWAVYIFPPTRLLEFALGMAMALIVRTGHWPTWLKPAPTGLLLAAAYLIAPDVPTDWEPVATTVIPFALLIPALATADVAGRPSIWRSRTAVWLGETSFAFYLIHQSVLIDLVRSFHAQNSGTATSALLIVVSLGLAVAVAGLMHQYLEQPMMRRFGRARRSAALQPAEPAEETITA